jgi:hypothetical protein
MGRKAVRDVRQSQYRGIPLSVYRTKQGSFLGYCRLPESGKVLRLSGPTEAAAQSAVEHELRKLLEVDQFVGLKDDQRSTTTDLTGVFSDFQMFLAMDQGRT